jgi:predicted phosphodiesterase
MSQPRFWLLCLLAFVIGSSFHWQLNAQNIEAPNKCPLPPPPSTTALTPFPIPDSQPTLHFVALGDMGSGAPFQSQIANRLTALHQQQPYPLMLFLGDILYPAGNVDQDGKRLITDMYAPLLTQNVRILGALGNHDYLYHHGDPLVQFLNMPGHYYHQRVGPVDFFALDTNDFDTKQAQWLKSELASAQAPWRVVFAHHPIYSSGEHGNNSHLLKTLAPLLANGQADVYLAGHDHEYERFNTEGGFLPIVSGGGGAYLRDFGKPDPNSLVRTKAHHVLVISVKNQQLEVEAVGANGASIDCVALDRPVGPLPKQTSSMKSLKDDQLTIPGAQLPQRKSAISGPCGSD